MEDRIYTIDSYETEEIPDMESVKKRLESEGFFVQMVYDSVGRSGNFSIIGNNSIEDFIGFAKRTNASIVMIDELRLDKESYAIETDFEDDVDFIQKDVDRFNESLDSIDFGKPYDVYLYFFYEGQPFGIRYQNSELVELASMSAEDRIHMFQEEHEEDMRRMLEERQRKVREMEDSLLNVLADDPQFQVCTNQAARVDFLRRFLERPENKEARELLQTGYGFLPASTLKGFGDRAWAIVKARKN